MSTPALILVRHGRPLIDRDKPATTWPLCPDGVAAVAALAGRLAAYAPTAIVASPEPKALETAELIAKALGLTVEVDAGLHEHKRPALSFGTEEAFRKTIAQVFANPATPVAGGESAHEACVRLAAALAQHPGRPLIAVTHGTVLSLYVAERLGLDAHDLWRSLHTPDAFVLDGEGALVTRIS
ncbi:histidine phosphatase family protein [Phenylobacterium sp.]|uniref:histidine phosphatase family protein n=1 Tax=Phenylobacterium sp. TaxID=1871053 RepID=UPI0025D1B457|nr:histidine phosphatase family protein [Phenylobacterium sp.]